VQPRQVRETPERPAAAMGVPDLLADDHAAQHRSRCQDHERQQRQAKANGSASGQRRRRPGAAGGSHQKQPGEAKRDERPDLDRRGETEQQAAARQTGRRRRHPVAVEEQHRAGQAEQVQPGLEQQGVRRDDRVRVHGVAAARDAHRERPAVLDEGAEQDDVRRVRAHGEQPPGRQAARGPRHLGQQRDRNHEQGAARRLHHGEVAVRHHPGDKAQRVTEQDAVVVFGHAEQVAGPRQLIQPQREGDRRAQRDDKAFRRDSDKPRDGAYRRRMSDRSPHHAPLPIKALSPRQGRPAD
jgi:hypothetical protein